jgi:hypothetical protein
MKNKIVKCIVCSSRIFLEKNKNTIVINGKETSLEYDNNLTNSFKINNKLICHRCIAEIKQYNQPNYKELDNKINELADIFVAENGLDLRVTQSMIDDFVLSHSEIVSPDMSYNLYGRMQKRVREQLKVTPTIKISKNKDSDVK